MPSLDDILKKNATKAKLVPNRASIATEDRPYSKFEYEPPVNTSTLQNSLHHNAYSGETEEIEDIENWQQTDNKPATNRQQTSNKPITKPQQPVDKKRYEKENWQQSGNETGNTTDNKVTTKWQQTDNKVATKTSFSELVGLQRNIIILICHECKNSRSRTTEALTLEHISTALKCSTGVVKTTIQRLEKKGCLLRKEFKNGRGGWSKYELPDNIYHDAVRSETDNKVATKWQQTDNKVATKPATEPTTSLSSSSSILNIKETTTNQLSDEWSFDISPYSKFGFTLSQLKQLSSLEIISAADVEQSLIEFHHDLTNNMLPAIKTGKINFLMGLLRSGHSYVSEDFKNEQEALISEMANRAESKRKKLLEDRFVVWESSLTQEERKAIEDRIPLPLRVALRAHGVNNLEVRTWLFNYYLQASKSDNK